MVASADTLEPALDSPRKLDPGLARSDRIFFASARSIGLLVLVITGSIGAFLGIQLLPTIQHYGFRFFTEENWNPELNVAGIAAAAVGTIEVAVISLCVAFPLALMTALYITEYAPRRIKSVLVSLVDLMAMVPSIAYGLWGFFLLEPRAKDVARWLAEWFSWIPLFRVHTVAGFGAHSPSWAQTSFTGSMFIAGVVVAMMVTPIACAVMRGVFAQTPASEREAALALGSTKWGEIRSVVLPFGRGGIIGGTMLGLGRALGETIAVLLTISTAYNIKIRILEIGGQTISALIASLFGDSTGDQIDALLAAGFVLFMMTLLVNIIAGMLITRSRSGAATDI
jgi:phosphate transport system permease protein